MRRRIFILLAAAGLLGPATELSAQRCLPGQTGVQLGGGACGGFLLRDVYKRQLSAIAYGYTRLLQESTHALQDLKEIVNPTEMSMTDKDRLDVIERVHAGLLRCRSLTAYYTRKNISVSLLRSRKKDNTERIMALYGGSEGEKYW